MKTLEDLYRENPQAYADIVAQANREHRALSVENDELILGESSMLEKDYKYYRYNEYPNIKDQLDMIWHAIDENKLDKTCDFYTTLKAVKDKFPKGE